MSCLQSVGGDVAKAQELYNFLCDGIESIPDYPVPQPTMMQQVTSTANGVFSWLKENQDDIMGIVNFVKQLRGSAPTIPQADIPPLPNL